MVSGGRLVMFRSFLFLHEAGELKVVQQKMRFQMTNKGLGLDDCIDVGKFHHVHNVGKTMP
jgi:hypothetical protein